jgi:hypothetical protein
MATPAMPVSAPAPAAPSAPAAAPSSAPSSAPATPATPTTPAVPGSPVAAPEAAAPVVAAEPKNTDFSGTRDGQLEFLRKRKEWEAKQPRPGEAPKPGEPVVAAVEAAAQLGAQPGEQPGNEGAAADPAAAKPAAEPAAPSPKALADLLEAKPALKAALEADPEAKGQLFSMARKLASAEEIMAIVPSKADAEFMSQHASEMVGLKTASMRLAIDPESAPQVLEILDSQFSVVDKEGKAVLGADGKPTFASDRKPFLDAVVNRELGGYKESFTSKVNELNAKLASGVYPNETAKAMDQQMLDNYEYAQLAMEVLPMMMDGSYFKPEAPEVPADADPAFKAWAEAEKARLQRESEALDAKKNGASKAERKAQSAQFNQTVRADMGSVAGEQIGMRMKEVIDSGTYIPEFYLQEKYVDPTTGQATKTSALVARVFMNFENALMKMGSRNYQEIVEHELLPQTEQTRELRKNWYARKAAEMIPGLVQAEVDKIQGLVKLDTEKQAQRLAARNGAAQPEPQSSSSALPAGATEAQMLSQAEENAKKDPRFAGADPGTKQAMILTQMHRLRPQRR